MTKQMDLSRFAGVIPLSGREPAEPALEITRVSGGSKGEVLIPPSGRRILLWSQGRARIENGAAMGRNIPPSSPTSSTRISAIDAYSGGMEEFGPFLRAGAQPEDRAKVSPGKLCPGN